MPFELVKFMSLLKFYFFICNDLSFEKILLINFKIYDQEDEYATNRREMHIITDSYSLY